MRIASIEAWSGAAGDMFLGALVGAGLDLGLLERELRKVAPSGWSISASSVRRAGLAGMKVGIERSMEPGSSAMAEGVGGHPHPHCGGGRSLPEILCMIKGAGLSTRASDLAVRAFRALAEAEAQVHGSSVEDVRFHEIGAIDSILDIVGTAVGFDLLGISETWCPGVATGWGTVRCSHGDLPVPAPATSILLRSIPTVSGSVEAELVTPTGAVLLSTLVDHWTPPPPAVWDKIGLGAGSADHPSPNLLRIRVGNPGIPCCRRTDEVLELVTLLDDMDPRLFPRLQDAVIAAGATDCYASHCIARKGRPAIEVTVVCSGESLETALDALLHNSTTLEVRIRPSGSRSLDRNIIEVDSQWGRARLRAGVVGGRYVNVNPEFADCVDLARKAGLPVRVVLDGLKAMASELEGREGGIDSDDP